MAMLIWTITHTAMITVIWLYIINNSYTNMTNKYSDQQTLKKCGHHHVTKFEILHLLTRDMSRQLLQDYIDSW